MPSRQFLTSIDPYFGIIHDRYTAPVNPDKVVGKLSGEWREKWGTGDEVAICGSIYDAHAGGVACGVGPGKLVKVIGTSAVDLLVAKRQDLIP